MTDSAAPSNRYIVRINEKTWRVAVTVSRTHVIRKNFSDEENGGKEKALVAAIEHRDAVMLEHGIVFRNGGRSKTTNTRNKTEAIGVSIIADNKTAPRVVTVVAKFMIDGKQHSAAFAVRRHGYAVAWQRAAIARRRHHPDAPIPMAPPEPPEWVVKWANGLRLMDPWITKWKEQKARDPEGKFIAIEDAGLLVPSPSAPHNSSRHHDMLSVLVSTLNSEAHQASSAELKKNRRTPHPNLKS